MLRARRKILREWDEALGCVAASGHLQSLRSPARIARKRTSQERSHMTPEDTLAAELKESE